jgi:hypothetical protein
MQYVCDAPAGATWFRLETEAEAEAEAQLMQHAVDRYFQRYEVLARDAYRAPAGLASFESEIGLKDHVRRAMPVFLTLRSADGVGLVTAMLPPGGRASPRFKIIVVGPENADPYVDQGEAIAALGRHYGIELKRAECYPYAR